MRNLKTKRLTLAWNIERQEGGRKESSGLNTEKESESGWTLPRVRQAPPAEDYPGLPARVRGWKKTSTSSRTSDGHHTRLPRWATAQVSGYYHGSSLEESINTLRQKDQVLTTCLRCGSLTSASADKSLRPDFLWLLITKEWPRQHQGRRNGRKRWTNYKASTVRHCRRFPSPKAGAQRRSLKQGHKWRVGAGFVSKLKLDFCVLKNDLSKNKEADSTQDFNRKHNFFTISHLWT